jgi:hypothetical protein
LALGQQDLVSRYELYEHLSSMTREQVAAETAGEGNGTDTTKNTKEVSA